MLQVIELTGTPHEMGQQHGEQLRDQVRGLAEERYEIACQFARDRGVETTRDECVKLAQVHLKLHQQHVPRCYEEWSGIAAGADCPLEDVFFANAPHLIYNFWDEIIEQFNLSIDDRKK